MLREKILLLKIETENVTENVKTENCCDLLSAREVFSNQYNQIISTADGFSCKLAF